MLMTLKYFPPLLSPSPSLCLPPSLSLPLSLQSREELSMPAKRGPFKQLTEQPDFLTGSLSLSFSLFHHISLSLSLPLSHASLSLSRLSLSLSLTYLSLSLSSLLPLYLDKGLELSFHRKDLRRKRLSERFSPDPSRL